MNASDQELSRARADLVTRVVRTFGTYAGAVSRAGTDLISEAKAQSVPLRWQEVLAVWIDSGAPHDQTTDHDWALNYLAASLRRDGGMCDEDLDDATRFRLAKHNERRAKEAARKRVSLVAELVRESDFGGFQRAHNRVMDLTPPLRWQEVIEAWIAAGAKVRVLDPLIDSANRSMDASLDDTTRTRLTELVNQHIGGRCPTTAAELGEKFRPILRAVHKFRLPVSFDIRPASATVFIAAVCPDRTIKDARCKDVLCLFVECLAITKTAEAGREIEAMMQTLGVWDQRANSFQDSLFEPGIWGLIACGAKAVVVAQMRNPVNLYRCATALHKAGVQPDLLEDRVPFLMVTSQWDGLAALGPAGADHAARFLSCVRHPDLESKIATACAVIARHGAPEAREMALEQLHPLIHERAIYKGLVKVLGFDPDRTINWAIIEFYAQKVRDGELDREEYWNSHHNQLSDLMRDIWPWIDDYRGLCGERILSIFEPLLEQVHGWSYLIAAAVVRTLKPNASVSHERFLLPLLARYAGKASSADGWEHDVLRAYRSRGQNPFRYQPLEDAASALARIGLSAPDLRMCFDAVLLHEYGFSVGADQTSDWMTGPGEDAVRALAKRPDEYVEAILTFVAGMPDATGHGVNPTRPEGYSAVVSMEPRRRLAAEALARRRSSFLARTRLWLRRVTGSG